MAICILFFPFANDNIGYLNLFLSWDVAGGIVIKQKSQPSYLLYNLKCDWKTLRQLLFYSVLIEVLIEEIKWLIFQIVLLCCVTFSDIIARRSFWFMSST